jgi:hypothetical protein
VKPFKLANADGFVLLDLPEATQSTGVARSAKKILVDGATTLARTVTYGYASLGMQRGGASVGINAEGEGRDAAVAAAIAEIADSYGAKVALSAGKGITDDDLAPLVESDQRSSQWQDHAPRLTAVGVLAAAGAATTLDGADVAIEEGPLAALLSEAFTNAGATASVVATAEIPTVSAAVLVCGSRVGVIDQAAAETIDVRLIVPCGPAPVGTKALAIARRRSIAVLPDFVTTAGGLIAQWSTHPGAPETETETAETIAGLITAAGEHSEGHYLGACVAAEAFMATWVETLPFGRPLP